MIVRGKDERMVGRIEGKTFIKEVYGSRHMLHFPAGWAIDADVFNAAIAPNCYSIHIIDRETGKRYIAGVKTFREKCQTLNRGHGKQYYLELVHWLVRDK